MSEDFEEHIRAVSVSLEDLKDASAQMKNRFAQMLTEVNAALHAAGLPSEYQVVWEEPGVESGALPFNKLRTFPGFAHQEDHFSTATGNCVCSCVYCGPYDRCTCIFGCKGEGGRHVHGHK